MIHEQKLAAARDVVDLLLATHPVLMTGRPTDLRADELAARRSLNSLLTQRDYLLRCIARMPKH